MFGHYPNLILNFDLSCIPLIAIFSNKDVFFSLCLIISKRYVKGLPAKRGAS